MAANFTYPGTRLAQREIRLLTLDPATSDTEQITCTISKGQLLHATRGSYEALSYCWGDPKRSYAIVCNDKPFPVTKNLFAALGRLRHANKPRTLWVDAMCINQSDNDEKSAQVSLMADIYRGCSRTLIWLGEEAEALAAVGFAIAERVHACFVRGNGLRGLETGSPSAMSRALEAAGLPGLMSDSWYQFSQVLELPYWKRMWILQEATLGASPLVQCGRQTISLPILQDAVRAMHYLRIPAIISGAKDGVTQLQVLKQSGAAGRGMPLWQLVDVCRRSQATDARDKVFALYGMTGDPAAGGIGLRPDYEMKENEVLAEASARMLQQSRTLLILGLAATVVEPDPGLPSWVLDLKQSRTTLVLPYDGTGFGVASPATMAFTRESFRAVFSTRGRQRTLRIEAIAFDEIVACAAEMRQPKLEDMDDARFMKGLRLSNRATRYYNEWIGLSMRGIAGTLNRHHRMDELFLAVSGGCGEGEFAARRAEFREWIKGQKIRKFITYLRLYWIHWMLHELVCILVLLPLFFCGFIKVSAQRATYPFTVGRRVCVTRNGNILLAPGRAKVGDEIFLVRGWHLPFVLRRRGKGGELLPEDHRYFIGDGCLPALSRVSDKDMESSQYASMSLWLV
ncbi:hypothetical protein OQA88_1243 [Cercophora sp. LCS_1]